MLSNIEINDSCVMICYPAAFPERSTRICNDMGVAFDIHELMHLAQSAARESATLDFKAKFDTTSQQDWCEIIKDIVAMANSGGGVLVIGVNDDGSPSSADTQAVLELDLAKISDKVRSYTSVDFDGVEINEVERKEHRAAAICISGVDIPIVFQNAGSFEYPSGKKVSAFAVGTIYFRHGAKSEPGTTDDIRACIEREVDRLRKAWLSNIRKVVEAPADAVVQVLDPTEVLGSTTIRIVDDPKAPADFAVYPDQTHPLRCKDVIKLLNDEISYRRKLSPHDLICARIAHDVDSRAAYFYSNPVHNNTPQYSHQLVAWLIDEFKQDCEFFEKARNRYQELGRPTIGTHFRKD